MFVFKAMVIILTLPEKLVIVSKHKITFCSVNCEHIKHKLHLETIAIYNTRIFYR